VTVKVRQELDEKVCESSCVPSMLTVRRGERPLQELPLATTSKDVAWLGRLTEAVASPFWVNFTAWPPLAVESETTLAPAGRAMLSACTVARTGLAAKLLINKKVPIKAKTATKRIARRDLVLASGLALITALWAPVSSFISLDSLSCVMVVCFFLIALVIGEPSHYC
jgi:hypothetical protein